MTSTPLNGRSWYDTELDTEHIWYRGFHMKVNAVGVLVDDPDVDELPPLIARSAWGQATLSHDRQAFPYNFHPTVFTGPQFCADSIVRSPAAFPHAGPGLELSARGAWVTLGERAPDFTDTLEIVVIPTGYDPSSPSVSVSVAQVLFDVRPYQVDPFVVAATRVLEPLIAELRGLISADGDHTAEISGLRDQVDRLEATLRRDREQPARMKAALTASLSAVGAIILNIIASRLDDVVPWDVVWGAVREAIRRLGL